MANQLDKAEQQLLGYTHARDGYSLGALIFGMGLTKSEWVKLKTKYGLEFLTTKDIKSIDEYFNDGKHK